MVTVKRPWLSQYDPGVPHEIQYPEVPLFQLFTDTAHSFPDRVCTVFEDTPVTFATMLSLVNRMAFGLEHLGVRKGDRVAICLPNIPQFVLTYYAVLMAGGVVVALNPLYKQRELEFHLRDSGAQWLIGLRGSAGLLRTLIKQESLRGLILTDLSDAFAFDQWERAAASPPELQVKDPGAELSLHDFIVRQPFDAKPQTRVGPDDTAVFQYSGGTTGVAKAAVGRHRNLVANSYQFRHWLHGLNDGEETTLMAIPMYHVYGMVVGMSVSMLLGAKMVLVPDPRNLPDLLANIQKYQASFFPGVPTLYAMINQNPDVRAGKYQLRSIRACISGSAPLLSDVKERFEELTGAQLMEGYGLSEAPTATHCNPMYGEKRAGSIGLPLPGVDCRILCLEDDETIQGPRDIGELLIRSPQVMAGYYNQPDETANALRNGWLHTGDIGWMDEDGYFYLVDRKKDLIKVSGFQVWPREIEEVIASHPSVNEASVAGIPDPIRGEAPKAWVVLQAGEQLEPDDVREWCEQNLVYYKVPVKVEFRDALPRTSVGKILRRELVRQHLTEAG